MKQCQDQRMEDAKRILLAYAEVERALGEVGRLLRTTEAGRYMWSAKHKTAVSGLKSIVSVLGSSVPRYDGSD